MVNRESLMRFKLINIAKKLCERGFMMGTWGNISVRLNKKSILITPSGFGKDVLKPSDLLVLNLNGEVIKGKWKPSIETPLHLTIYRARSDVNAIIHTHSFFATILAVLGQSIPVLTTQFASTVGHEIPVTRSIKSGTEEMAKEVVEILKNGSAILLRRHGIIVVGNSLEHAYQIAVDAELEAKIFFHIKLIGGQIEELRQGEITILRDFYRERYGQVDGIKIM
ncbi:MAG: class II aldolase/adducin family protein [Nitrososphaerota archaeon]